MKSVFLLHNRLLCWNTKWELLKIALSSWSLAIHNQRLIRHLSHDLRTLVTSKIPAYRLRNRTYSYAIWWTPQRWEYYFRLLETLTVCAQLSQKTRTALYCVSHEFIITLIRGHSLDIHFTFIEKLFKNFSIIHLFRLPFFISISIKVEYIIYINRK